MSKKKKREPWEYAFNKSWFAFIKRHHVKLYWNDVPMGGMILGFSKRWIKRNKKLIGKV